MIFRIVNAMLKVVDILVGTRVTMNGLFQMNGCNCMLKDLEKKQTENTPKNIGSHKTEKIFTIAFLIVTVSVILLLFVVRNIDTSQ